LFVRLFVCLLVTQCLSFFVITGAIDITTVVEQYYVLSNLVIKAQKRSPI